MEKIIFLSKTTVLQNLPKELDDKTLLTLDAIRITIEMIEYNYNELYNILLKTSKQNEKHNSAMIFNFCWSIIDHSSRLFKIYKTLKSENGHNNILKIKYVNDARNTFQHIAERIDEILLEKSMSFYGLLKWVYSDENNKKAINIISISGLYYGQQPTFKVENYSKDKIKSIILETVKVKSEWNNITKKREIIKKSKLEINLTQLILDIKDIIQLLETNLSEQFNELNMNLVDWSKKKDVLFILKKQ